MDPKMLLVLISCIIGITSAISRIRDAELSVPTNKVICNCDEKTSAFYKDLDSITKVCASSTVINPDKKKSKQGRSSCIFDKLGCLNKERTKVDWDKFKTKLLGRDDIIKQCKDTNYDTDVGFWDSVGDWLFGENFDFDSLERALSNFFSCCNHNLLLECEAKFVKKIPKPA